MDLNDLLRKQDIDPRQVLVFRHRPFEPDLNKDIRRLAADKPEIFNAYQQTQGERVEKAMQRAAYVASFIGHEAGKALFVGLYSVGATRPLTLKEYWNIPAHAELRELGMKGFTEDSGRSSQLWFDLSPTEFCVPWKGKLIVEWPGREVSWWRWAERNAFRILAILEESALVAKRPKWNEVILTWGELRDLPTQWKTALSEWRGIYYIFDTSDRERLRRISLWCRQPRWQMGGLC